MRKWAVGLGRGLACVGLCAVVACSSEAEEPSAGDEALPTTGAGQGAPSTAGQSAGAGAQAPAGSGGAEMIAPTVPPLMNGMTTPSGPGPATTADAGPGTMADAGMGPGPGPATGTRLPPLADPGDKGPFEIQVVENLPGLATHILIAPRDLGKDGLKHPVLVWINGAGANSSSYRAMHDNLAAQGFVIIDDKQSTFEAIPEIDSQKAGIDWVIAQTKDMSSPYFGKFDDTRIAIGGHSLGSVASFGNVADMRITTSVHMAGGVTGNPGGVDNNLIKSLRAPAMFLVGTADSNGIGRVRMDFALAPPAVPLFFATLDGVGHTDEFSKANGGRWGRIVAAWLRWRLADDDKAAALFTGDGCEFCKGDWVAMKRGL